MKKNVGGLDRAIRAIAGIAAIAVFLLGMVEGTLGIIVLVVGIVLLGTSAIGWCPPYAILGISSCNSEEKES